MYFRPDCFYSVAQAQSKPKLTLDEFFNSVSFPTIALSPDGNGLVIGAERADWDQQIFRNDLWLYHDDGGVARNAQKRTARSFN